MSVFIRYLAAGFLAAMLGAAAPAAQAQQAPVSPPAPVVTLKSATARPGAGFGAGPETPRTPAQMAALPVQASSQAADAPVPAAPHDEKSVSQPNPAQKPTH